MASSFTVKLLRVTFTLNNASNAVFPGNPGQASNVLQLTGLRMLVNVEGAGYPSWLQATIKIFGMAPADMNALAVQQNSAGKTGYLPNTVLVEANSGSGWSAVFAGNILTAAPDYSSIPDVPLICTSVAGLYDQVNPATPSSFPTGTAIADLLSVVVAKTNFAFVNNGVTGTTGGATYYPYASLDQVRAICGHFNLDPVIDQTGHTITVSPRGQADASPGFTLSPGNGLVGYPVPQANGFLAIRAEYNPGFHIKSPITIAGSDVVVNSNSSPEAFNSIANGNWIVTSIANELSTLVPDGPWFSNMVLYPPGVTAVTT